jgi:hypothetical protein
MQAPRKRGARVKEMRRERERGGKTTVKKRRDTNRVGQYSIVQTKGSG